MNHGSITPDTGFYDESACSLADFAAHTAQKTNIADIPNAIAAPKNVPVYD
ncbi:MAG: phytanoyl-CoA dioxygenase, partial [Yoonia sp.]|nr:phytanoyl-CoA dioxygenase [Yoonia sp.]